MSEVPQTKNVNWVWVFEGHWSPRKGFQIQGRESLGKLSPAFYWSLMRQLSDENKTIWRVVFPDDVFRSVLFCQKEISKEQKSIITSVVERKVFTGKDVHVQIPRSCEYALLHGKEGLRFLMDIKMLLTNWHENGDVNPALCRWAWCSYSGLEKTEEGNHSVGAREMRFEKDSASCNSYEDQSDHKPRAVGCLQNPGKSTKDKGSPLELLERI
jgi:hypothetical protein